jgi:hypothetical protein
LQSLDINEAAVAETAHETGGFAIAADVTDAASVEAAVAAARERHGPARMRSIVPASAPQAALSDATARCGSTRSGG